ncbi:MAG: ABC transporter permease subunit [Spirochaetaceae bacterium]|jgi:D-methionine transport system permease protein|nr:ABC transporter permease subunit [Spirochaetaceae bacterium]
MPKGDFLELLNLLLNAAGQTLWMTLIPAVFACILGIPAGTYLFAASPSGIRPRPAFYGKASRVVAVFRSAPAFIILTLLLLPLFQRVSESGAAIIPLSFGAVCFAARIVETALSRVNPGLLSAARSMGSTDFQIAWKVLIPEALPNLVSGLALTLIYLIGYSAMAGAVGGRGLGAAAVHYPFRIDITIAAVMAILILSEVVHWAGIALNRRLRAAR